jgi:esterase/lipase
VNAYQFQRGLSVRLLVWSALSVTAGSFLIQGARRASRRREMDNGPGMDRGPGRDPGSSSAPGSLKAFGQQAVAWGLVDGLIAAYGFLSARPAASPDGEAALASRLRRLLWLNAGLDLGYIAGGLALARRRGQANAAWRGHGWGVLVQGGFLLLFDLYHALRAPLGDPPERLPVYQEPEFGGYLLPAEGDAPGGPAALVVHGFPGTPQEVRPLAEALQRQGWRVQALLLPGFGPELATLERRTWQDWLRAVEQALVSLQREHHPVLLAGFSMGGALSAQAAARLRPDALVLLAPFLLPDAAWLRRALGSLLFCLPQRVRPYRWRRFTTPTTRRRMERLLEEANQAGPGERRRLLDAHFPSTVMQQVFEAGMAGCRAAQGLDLPLLVVQGTRDRLVWARRTRRMLGCFPCPPEYVEVQAGHELFEAGEPGWKQAERAVLEFTGRFVQ